MFEKELAKNRKSLHLTVVIGIAIDQAWSN